jgi:hypothetical protein
LHSRATAAQAFLTREGVRAALRVTARATPTVRHAEASALALGVSPDRVRYC